MSRTSYCAWSKYRFLIRVLDRSYLAGEWEVVGENKMHDGLRQVFLFFVDNRDVSNDGRSSKGGMKVNKK